MRRQVIEQKIKSCIEMYVCGEKYDNTFQKIFQLFLAL